MLLLATTRTRTSLDDRFFIAAGPRLWCHHHHHIRLFEVVKRNRQHTVQKIDVGIYMDIHTIHAS